MDIDAVELDSTNQKFIDFKNELDNHDMIVNKIYKITNLHLKVAFDTEKINLKQRKNKGFELNILNLYHGTQADWKLLSHEGLDERLSRRGRFGRGIYFSDNPEKSCKYAKENADSGNPFILSCKVILGDIKIFPDGVEAKELRREPIKENLNGKIIYYDSVKGHPKDFTEYVVYDKRRVLIKYIIFFSFTSQPKGLVNNSKDKGLQNDNDNSDSDGSAGDDDNASCDSMNNSDENIVAISNTPASNQAPRIIESAVMAEQKKLALLQLIDMRSKITNESLKELIIAFIQTYGPDESLNKFFAEIISTLPPITPNTLLTASNLEPESEVLQSQIKEFKDITRCSNEQDCKKFLKLANMNLQSAITLYYDQSNIKF